MKAGKRLLCSNGYFPTYGTKYAHNRVVENLLFYSLGWIGFMLLACHLSMRKGELAMDCSVL